MRDPIVIVGSGASGVHFAQTAIDMGRSVIMLDVGHERPTPPKPDLDLNGLKRGLSDPLAYFLGQDFESLVLPGSSGEYYGFPPSKSYVFARGEAMPSRSTGFSPLFSHAAGGLAEAWTGGTYPFTDVDLDEFPFSYADLAPFYGEVARRIGVSGVEDDLAPFFPRHAHLLDPLELDTHSRQLLDRYDDVRGELNGKYKCFLGRARLAALTRDQDGRGACSYLGRCLWGCPSEALYTPSLTLDRLKQDANFTYVPGARVTHFTAGDDGRVASVSVQAVGTRQGGPVREFSVGTLVLAAGTLGSSKIFLDSMLLVGGDVITLPGLIDNRQVLMPFVNMSLVGRPWDPRTYQYHQIAMALDADDPREHVHGLVTTLKTALIHSIVQSVPSSVGLGLALVRNVHGALGLVNINFTDRRRPESYVTLDPDHRTGTSRLVIQYEPAPDEPARIRRTTKTFRKVLRRLGCRAPRKMIHRRPMGASVHYAGTVPMCAEGGDLTCDENGRCRGFENLYFVDGTTFPSLPAKNLTFTLMANATRIATNVAG